MQMLLQLFLLYICKVLIIFKKKWVLILSMCLINGYQPDNKCQTLKCADLGGAQICNYCMKHSTDSENAAEQKFSA